MNNPSISPVLPTPVAPKMTSIFGLSILLDAILNLASNYLPNRQGNNLPANLFKRFRAGHADLLGAVDRGVRKFVHVFVGGNQIF